MQNPTGIKRHTVSNIRYKCIAKREETDQERCHRQQLESVVTSCSIGSMAGPQVEEQAPLQTKQEARHHQHSKDMLTQPTRFLAETTQLGQPSLEKCSNTQARTAPKGNDLENNTTIELGVLQY